MVKEATNVTDGSGVHKRLGDGAAAGVLPHCDNVVAVHRFLAELPAPGLLEADHLPCVLAHKCSSRYVLQRPNSPALVLCAEHLQPESEARLDHSVAAGITAATEGVAFKDRRAVARVNAAEVNQFARFAVCLTVCPQAGAALGGAGPKRTGASGQSDLTGVNGASWSLDVIWRVLKIGHRSTQPELVKL